jgi:hypothetical protein
MGLGGFASIFFFALTQQAGSSTPLDPGSLLYSAFSTRCKAAGPETSRALDDTQSLEAVLIQIKEDTACAGLSGLLQEVIRDEEFFDFFKRGLDGDELSSLHQYERRLSIALALATDSATRNSLEGELANIRLQIELMPLEDEQRQRYYRARSTGRLSLYLNKLSTALPNYQLCFQRNPTLPAQIAGQLLAISGGFFDPTAHLAVSLAGSLLNSFFEYITQISINRKIADYRKTTMRLGIACALEALEQSVCDVEDQFRLVDYLMDVQEDEVLDLAWQGRELLIHDYPILERFLNLIEAGSEAQSEEQGDRRARFFEKEGENRAARERVISLINAASRRLEKFRSRDQRQDFLNSLVDDMAQVMMRGGGFNDVIPGEDSYAGGNRKISRAKIWLRIGLKEPPLPPEVSNYDELLQRIESGEVYAEVDAVRAKDPLTIFRSHFEVISEAAHAQLEVERVETINTDKEGALASWAQIGIKQDDAGSVLEKIVAYLQGLEELWAQKPEWFSSDSAREALLQKVQDTRNRFQMVLKSLFQEGSVEERLSKIFHEMELQDRTTFISNRLREIVEQDLVLQVRFGNLLQQEPLVQSLVTRSTNSLLRSFSPEGDLANAKTQLVSISNDLAGARLIGLANIKHFFKHWGEDLLNSLRHVNEICGPNCFNLPPQDPAWDEFHRLCSLALNYPMLNDQRDDLAKKISSLCQGSEFKIYRNRRASEVMKDDSDGELRLGWDRLKPEPVTTRICSYRRLQNRAELVEMLRRKRSFEN